MKRRRRSRLEEFLSGCGWWCGIGCGASGWLTFTLMLAMGPFSLDAEGVSTAPRFLMSLLGISLFAGLVAISAVLINLCNAQSEQYLGGASYRWVHAKNEFLLTGWVLVLGPNMLGLLGCLVFGVWLGWVGCGVVLLQVLLLVLGLHVITSISLQFSAQLPPDPPGDL